MYPLHNIIHRKQRQLYSYTAMQNQIENIILHYGKGTLKLKMPINKTIVKKIVDK